MCPASSSHGSSIENKITQSVSVNRAMAEIPPTSDSHRSATKVSGGVHAIPFLHSIDCGVSPSPSSPEWVVVHGTVQHMPQLYRKVAGSIQVGRTQRVFIRGTGTQPTWDGFIVLQKINSNIGSHEIIGMKYDMWDASNARTNTFIVNRASTTWKHMVGGWWLAFCCGINFSFEKMVGIY